MNHKTKIHGDTVDGIRYVVVTKGNKEQFRAVKTTENIALAHAIYIGCKYGDRRTN